MSKHIKPSEARNPPRRLRGQKGETMKTYGLIHRGLEELMEGYGGECATDYSYELVTTDVREMLEAIKGLPNEEYCIEECFEFGSNFDDLANFAKRMEQVE